LHQLGRFPDVQLAHHIGPVPFHGTDTDTEQISYFLVGFAFCDELEYLALPDGQWLCCLNTVLPASDPSPVLHGLVRKAGGNVNPPVANIFNR